MLEDVRDVGAFVESLDESARLAACALVELKRRHGIDQPLIHVRDGLGCDVFECAKPDVARDYRCESPEVRSAQGTNAGDLELGGVQFGRGFSC